MNGVGQNSAFGQYQFSSGFRPQMGQGFTAAPQMGPGAGLGRDSWNGQSFAGRRGSMGVPSQGGQYPMQGGQSAMQGGPAFFGGRRGGFGGPIHGRGHRRGGRHGMGFWRQLGWSQGAQQADPQQMADQIWSKLDPSGSGTITKAQFEQFIEQRAEQGQQTAADPMTAPTALADTSNDPSSDPNALADTSNDPSSDPNALADTSNDPSSDPNALADASNDPSSDPTALADPAASSASGSAASANDPATIQQEILTQIQQYEQSSDYTSLSAADQQSVQQTATAISQLDPTDPAFMTNLSNLLGYDPTTGQPVDGSQSPANAQPASSSTSAAN